jgi:hypothetical protein
MLLPTLIKKKKTLAENTSWLLKITWEYFPNISYLREIFSTRVIILSELCRQIFLIYVRFFPSE